MSHVTIEHEGAATIKAWVHGVPIEAEALNQLRDTASLPIVGPHLAVMPDCHWGLGSTVGSVVPTRHAIIPACVGVDLGCGMSAVPTDLMAQDLGDSGQAIREAIESAVPHGRTDNGGVNDRGAWGADSWSDARKMAAHVLDDARLKRIVETVPHYDARRMHRQLGTLGTGNHFVEVCLDENDRVWIMLHSGSRGTGNTIAQFYIAKARRRAEEEGIKLPNRDLAWLPEGTPEFDAYIDAISWAQDYAAENRKVMVAQVFDALRTVFPDRGVRGSMVVQCHHNYVSREKHFGEDLYITRKGAVSARQGEMGIIPGAMGRKSFIVRGKGNAASFHSCSHGAGRVMSRGKAKKEITLEMHAEDTAGVFCRKDVDVLDESPRAYKDIASVMSAQSDLVDVVHELHAVVCVKG